MANRLLPNSHIIDSRFYANGYATDEARRVFCDIRRMQRWLDIEATLARCQATLGIIPEAIAASISETARIERLDVAAITDGIARTGHSLIPLLKEWQRVTDPQAGQFIHYGATTQDIQDTAQSLELKEISTILTRDLRIIIDLIAGLTARYRDVVTIGRSHGQHALPTTMGLKMAGWLDEALRNHARLETCLPRLLAAQLFGGVGTMAALSDQGLELLDHFAAALGLSVPLSCWHSSRDRTVEFASTLAMITGGLARIANEICQLARNEIDEMAEPFVFGQIGSTTMPHKKNPELCEQVVVLARLVKGNAATLFDSLCNEHERDYRAVRLEWVALTEACTFTCAALRMMKTILGGLVVNLDRIQENLDRFAVLISTEALMFLLGEKIGKQSAHSLIYEASLGGGNGTIDQQGLIDRLMSHQDVDRHFRREDLVRAVDPARHTGLAGQIIDRVLLESRALPPGPSPEPPQCQIRIKGLCPCC